MDPKVLQEEVRQMRGKLRELYTTNKLLKHQVSEARSNVKEARSASDKFQFLQKTLHGYVGVWAAIKKHTLEIHFNPSYNEDAFRGQYEIIFSTSGNVWKVLGCRLPHSTCTKVEGKVLRSLEELNNFIRGLRGEIHGYIQRKIQVESAAEILRESKMPSDIWYSISIQDVFLSIPMQETDSQIKWEIQLRYDSGCCLPDKVTTNAQGLEETKLLMLRKRLDHLFKTYPLNVILKQEFGNDSIYEDSLLAVSSVSQLESS